nr:unnamed protein product [Digitaria exilis]
MTEETSHQTVWKSKVRLQQQHWRLTNLPGCLYCAQAQLTQQTSTDDHPQQRRQPSRARRQMVSPSGTINPR